MGVISNKIDRDKLKPGDHIYSYRAAYIYSHHGIYVGDGKVIHFTNGAAGQEVGTGTVFDGIIGSSVPKHHSDIPCPNCGDQSGLSGVLSSCLDCFLSGGDPYLFEYGVSSVYFLAKVRGGCCTQAVSDPPEKVLHRASFLHRNGFGDYDIFSKNCEDFAIYCKTGLLVCGSNSIGQSGQAATFFSAADAAAAATFLPLVLRSSFLRSSFLGSSIPGLQVIISCGKYCVDRYVSDIGIRSDVIVVPVENLATVKEFQVAPNVATEH